MPNIIDERDPAFVALTDKRKVIEVDGPYAVTAFKPIVTTIADVLDQNQVVLTPWERDRVIEHGSVESDDWLIQCVLREDDVPSIQYL